jgi:hypothetical protein
MDNIKEYKFEHIETPKQGFSTKEFIIKTIKIILFCIVVIGTVGFGDHKEWLD